MQPVRQDVVEEFGDAFGTAPDKVMACGPFVLEEWVHNSKIVFAKNSTYWDVDNVLPDYLNMKILSDEAAIVGEFESIQKDYYGDPILATRGYWDEYLKGPWKLEILNVNPEDFDDRTVNAFLERDFGNVNTYIVPNDKERTDIQRKIAKSTGMNEPVIVERKPNGKYELIEGWHRTMSILLLGDNGEDLKNWDKVKIRAFVRHPYKLHK
jgi:ABC-type transport system substrate-binding protein